MFWVPLIIGAAMSRQADMEAEDRRQKLLDAMKAYQLGKTKESEEAIETLLKKETPDARKAQLDDIIKSRAASLESSVDAVKSTNPAPIAGKLSADYQQSQEKVASTVAERTRRAIEQLATMGAPGERDIKTGLAFGKAATDVDSANTAIRNVGDAYLTSINNVRANPTRKMIGSALMAYGMGAGGAAAAGGGINSGGYEDASGNLYNNGANSANARLANAYSLWGRR